MTDYSPLSSDLKSRLSIYSDCTAFLVVFSIITLLGFPSTFLISFDARLNFKGNLRLPFFRGNEMSSLYSPVAFGLLLTRTFKFRTQLGGLSFKRMMKRIGREDAFRRWNSRFKFCVLINLGSQSHVLRCHKAWSEFDNIEIWNAVWVSLSQIHRNVFRQCNTRPWLLCMNYDLTHEKL